MRSPLCYSLILLATLSISACEKKHALNIELVKGEFTTPHGRFDIVVSESSGDNDKLYRSHSNTEKYYLQASDGVVFTKVAVLPVSWANTIVHDADLGKDLIIDRLSYQLSGIEYPILLRHPPKYSDYKTATSGEMVTSHYFLDLPAPLAGLDLTAQADSINQITVNKVKNDQAKVHHLTIDFRLNDEAYKFDVKFRVIVDDRYSIGIPGGAP